MDILLWNNHASHASAYNLRNKMYQRILFSEYLKDPKEETTC